MEKEIGSPFTVAAEVHVMCFFLEERREHNLISWLSPILSLQVCSDKLTTCREIETYGTVGDEGCTYVRYVSATVSVISLLFFVHFFIYFMASLGVA